MRCDSALIESIKNCTLTLESDGGLVPCRYLPEPVLDAAMGYHNRITENVDCCTLNKGDRITDLSVGICSTCFAYGMYEDAFQYGIWAMPSIKAVPFLYTMLVDGLGVERNEELADSLLDAMYYGEADEKLAIIVHLIRNSGVC